MSVNLIARTKNGEIHLWQTPSWVTQMCLINSDNEIKRCKGKSAFRAMYCYIAWVRGQLNGVYPSDEALKEKREIINSHVDYVEANIKKPRLIVEWI